MENIKLTEKSAEIFNYVKANGGRVSVEELTQATGRTSRSLTANINDLCKKELCVRDKVKVEGQEKPVTYVCLTDTGKEFSAE